MLRPRASTRNTDVFYRKDTVSHEKISNYSSETDESENDETVDEMEGSDGLTIVGTEHALRLNLNISHMVNKVRRVAKLFKRSPLKNEILQNYVKEKHSNGLQLILN